MNVLRLKFFSEQKKKKEKKVLEVELDEDDLKGLALIGGGKAARKISGKLFDIDKKPGDEDLRNKVINQAKKNNVGVHETNQRLGNAQMIDSNKNERTLRVNDETFDISPNKKHIVFGKTLHQKLLHTSSDMRKEKFNTGQ